MAKTNNLLFINVSGAVGREIVFKQYYNRTVVSKIPDMSKRVLSEKQLALNGRMREANGYAKSIYTTEESKAAARQRLKLPAQKSLYHALVKEYMDRQV